jgi:hypothetical protein
MRSGGLWYSGFSGDLSYTGWILSDGLDGDCLCLFMHHKACLLGI